MGDVVEIGEFKLVRQHREGWRSLEGECAHKHLRIDRHGDVVRCADCNTQVSAFWALSMMIEEYDRAWQRLQAGRRNLADAKAKDIQLLAAKEVETAWRSRTMVPSCPHCGRGIGPYDGFGRSKISKEIEERRRKIEAMPKKKE